MSKFGVLLCQTPPVPSDVSVDDAKRKALASARDLVCSGLQQYPESRIVVLPEMFACVYGTKFFEPFKERIPEVPSSECSDESPSVAMLMKLAREKGVWLIGGSVSECADGKLYNTCLVVDDKGTLIAKHRKVHLFDIDVPGKITFKESDTLSPGNDCTMVDTPFAKIGLGICYDIRFPELAMKMIKQGCKILVYPGAFNTTTGPAHWKLLAQARAVDNQCYVVCCSPARSDKEGDYPAYGHSLVVDPWGEVKSELEEKAGTSFVEIDPSYVDEVRQRVPILRQKRPEVYSE